MRDFFTDHGFIPNIVDKNILEAEFDYDDGVELAEMLGLLDGEFESLVIQVNVDKELAMAIIDGALESIDVGDLMSALEGEVYD